MKLSSLPQVTPTADSKVVVADGGGLATINALTTAAGASSSQTVEAYNVYVSQSKGIDDTYKRTVRGIVLGDFALLWCEEKGSQTWTDDGLLTSSVSEVIPGYTRYAGAVMFFASSDYLSTDSNTTVQSAESSSRFPVIYLANKHPRRLFIILFGLS